MDNSIVHKYISGIATEEETVQLYNWLKESPEHQAYLFDIKAMANACQISAKITEMKIEDSLTHLNKRIEALAGRKKYQILYNSKKIRSSNR